MGERAAILCTAGEARRRVGFARGEGQGVGKGAGAVCKGVSRFLAGLMDVGCDELTWKWGCWDTVQPAGSGGGVVGLRGHAIEPRVGSWMKYSVNRYPYDEYSIWRDVFMMISISSGSNLDCRYS